MVKDMVSEVYQNLWKVDRIGPRRVSTRLKLSVKLR